MDRKGIALRRCWGKFVLLFLRNEECSLAVLLVKR